MTLSYYDCMKADLSALLEASKMWKKMGEQFGELGTDYKHNVNSLTQEGEGWTGVGSQGYRTYSGKTLHEFNGAKKQAKAIASLLEDAFHQLTALRKKVERTRDAAIEAGMRVDAYGTCNFDFSDATENEKRALAHDPGLADTENMWTRKIRKAVEAVSEADHGVKLALETVTKDRDGKGDLSGFNSAAMGDVEKYEGRRAAELGMKLNSGEQLSKQELSEFQRLNRDNAHNTSYSRTLLNSLRADGTARLSIQLNAVIHGSDPGNKGQHSVVARQLATILDTATTVAGDDKKADREFRSSWLKQMREVGTKDYPGALGPGHPLPESGHTKVKGYQVFMTLIESGDPEGYSPGFLKSLSQDIYEVEQDSKGNIWDINQAYAGKKADWFAHDPLDSALGALSHHPQTSSEFLDPGPNGDNKKLDYLFNERDWATLAQEQVDLRGHVGRQEPTVNFYEAWDARDGFSDALYAAATGIDPSAENPTYAEHTEANERVFDNALRNSSELGQELPTEMRDDMAKLIGNYSDQAHMTMSAPLGGGPLNEEHLFNVTKEISKDQDAYALLNEGMNSAMVDYIYEHTDPERHPEDSLDRAGRTIGFLEEARYQALDDEKQESLSDVSWAGTGGFEVVAETATAFPVAGPHVTNAAYVVSQAWVEDETQRINEQWTLKDKKVDEVRDGQLETLADLWYNQNTEWANNPTHEGYSSVHGVYSVIGKAANDARMEAGVGES